MISIQRTHQPSLVDVQLAYEQWRSTRTVRGATPARLRAMAARLLSDHSPAAVCDALGVNATALKQWAEQTATEHHRPIADFVPLPVPDEPEHKTSINDDSNQFIIHLPNGIQVSTHSSCNLAYVLATANALGANI